MNNIFTSAKKCGLFDKPTHIAHGKISGNYKFDMSQHDNFINEYAKSKTDKNKKNYDTCTYSPISNTWNFYNL